jgi:hypothetical protein
MTFRLCSLGLGLFLGTAAYTFGIWTVRRPELWRRLPRARFPGVFVGAVCLVWSVVLVNRMFEGDMVRYRHLVRLAAPAIGVLAYFYLDYLFARALGGLLVLLANFLLHGAFALDVPARPLYAICCYIVGIAGLFFIGAPWRLRDLLERARDHRNWRSTLVAGNAFLALIFVLYAGLR